MKALGLVLLAVGILIDVLFWVYMLRIRTLPLAERSRRITVAIALATPGVICILVGLVLLSR